MEPEFEDAVRLQSFRETFVWGFGMATLVGGVGTVFRSWLEGSIEPADAPRFAIVAVAFGLVFGLGVAALNRGARREVTVEDGAAFLECAHQALRRVGYRVVSSGPVRLVAESRRIPRRMAGRIGVLVQGKTAHILGPRSGLGAYQRRIERLVGQSPT